MKLWNLFKNRKTEQQEEWENEDGWKAETMCRDRLDVHNRELREKFVCECAEQIKEATDEINKATMEYRLVTDYLTDMEEIEMLPEEERSEINKLAMHMVDLKKTRSTSESKIGNMTDVQFRNMERFEDDMPEALDKLIKDEEYRVLVREDLRNLEGEKMSSQFRKRELAGTKANTKGLTVIVIMAASITILMLLIFQFAMEMDTKIGYLITIGISAISFTLVFLRYNTAAMEYTKVSKRLNQLILLQNTVKIRYINITNVIDYNYAKYSINSSDELRYLWEKYEQEKAERLKFQEAEEELNEYKEELIKSLQRIRIKDAGIWVHQVEALLDSKEMVEIRHELIIRRQAMRKRIEYNTDNRNSAMDEIKSLASDYPQYAAEIKTWTEHITG